MLYQNVLISESELKSQVLGKQYNTLNNIRQSVNVVHDNENVYSLSLRENTLFLRILQYSIFETIFSHVV
jgi:hypothetical protein